MTAFEWNDREWEHYQRIFELLHDHLDEKSTRLLETALALSMGDGGYTAIFHDIKSALLRLVREDAQGEPEYPLLWTAKSLSHLAEAITAQGVLGKQPRPRQSPANPCGFAVFEGSGHLSIDRL